MRSKPRFAGHLDTTFTTKAAPEAVRAALADPGTWKRLQTEIVHTEDVDEHTLDVTLKEHTHGPAKFQARYRCRWQSTPEGSRWDSEPGANFSIHGRTTVSAAPGGGSRVRWVEDIEADIPVPRLMVRVIKPVADRLMARGLQEFIDVVKADLDRSA